MYAGSIEGRSMGVCLVKCRLSIVNFVECVVWWLKWVAFALHVGHSVVL